MITGLCGWKVSIESGLGDDDGGVDSFTWLAGKVTDQHRITII